MTFSVKNPSDLFGMPAGSISKANVSSIIDRCVSYLETVEGLDRNAIGLKTTLKYRDGTLLYNKHDKTVVVENEKISFGNDFNFNAADDVHLAVVAQDKTIKLSYFKGEGRVTVDTCDSAMSARLKQFITRNGYPETNRSKLAGLFRKKPKDPMVAIA